MKYGFLIFFFAFILSMIVYTIVRGCQVLAPYGYSKTVYLVLMIVLQCDFNFLRGFKIAITGIYFHIGYP